MPPRAKAGRSTIAACSICTGIIWNWRRWRPKAQPDPVSVKLQLDDYLAAPKWAGEHHFRDLPAASLVETARHFGAPFPPGVQVEGKVQGGIGYSEPGGLQGNLALDNASMKFPGARSRKPRPPNSIPPRS